MQRRIAIKTLLSFCGGVWVLYSVPGCGLNDTAESGESKLTAKELGLLSDMCNTIIPPTDTPGAGELGVHLFIIKMVEDCRPPAYLQSFKAGLDKLPQYAKAKTGKSWSSLKADQKLLLLQQVQKDKQADKDLQTCVGEVRALTIRGYSNSKYVMTKLVPYQLVPGHFNGCVPAAHHENSHT
jgi:hypothetical protein